MEKSANIFQKFYTKTKLYKEKFQTHLETNRWKNVKNTGSTQ